MLRDFNSSKVVAVSASLVISLSLCFSITIDEVSALVSNATEIELKITLLWDTYF